MSEMKEDAALLVQKYAEQLDELHVVNAEALKAMRDVDIRSTRPLQLNHRLIRRLYKNLLKTSKTLGKLYEGE